MLGFLPDYAEPRAPVLGCLNRGQPKTYIRLSSCIIPGTAQPKHGYGIQRSSAGTSHRNTLCVACLNRPCPTNNQSSLKAACAILPTVHEAFRGVSEIVSGRNLASLALSGMTLASNLHDTTQPCGSSTTTPQKNFRSTTTNTSSRVLPTTHIPPCLEPVFPAPEWTGLIHLPFAPSLPAERRGFEDLRISVVSGHQSSSPGQHASIPATPRKQIVANTTCTCMYIWATTRATKRT